ncbi:MAG: lipopolysaccharide biosynthesis protein [Prevotella sp.]|nr:lipopolysaccharide biosynthesis protein [Prevotella sp.]
MAETLKEKTAKGLFWGAMNNGVQQLLGIVFGIIMARLLVPEEFGLVAMILVFSAIANALQNSGFSTALINEKEQRAENYNSVFWFNILMGLGLYVVLFFCAPLIADYYHEPRLVWLSRYAFLSFVISSTGVAQAAYLYKNLRAKELAKANIIGVLLSSGVAVAMAWAGCSYWSIATQTNLFILISTLLRWHYSEWRPARRVDFTFVKRAFPFSIKILLSEMLTQLNNNVMNILLGRYFGSHSTGQYNQAYQWNFKGYSLVQNMMKQVDQTVLVSLSDERERQLAVLRKMVRFAAFIACPLMLGFGLVAKEFIVLTISEVWLTSAGYIQILCVAGAVIPVSTLLTDLVISKGRSDIFLWSTLAFAVCQILTLVVLHRLGYSIRAMVIAYTVLTLLWLFVWHFFVRRLTGYTLLMLLKDVSPFALAATAVMGVTWLATHGIANLWLLLGSRVVLAAMLYYIIMRMAGAAILKECINFIRRKKL